MASVFLSYDRDDGVKARPIASALEKAGHSVWWDKHISGGTQYAKEIEQALNSADIVVVLWSASSVESPWVRDEAGSGRDRGRLVPLSLEGTSPPLGFRQFQSIDLGRWPGRGKVPRLAEVLAAIDRQLREPGIPVAVAATAPSTRFRGRVSFKTWLIVGLVIMGLGLGVSRPWETSASRLPIVGVAAADASPESKALAQSLYSKLNALGDVAADKWQLAAPGADAPRPRLIFQTARTSSRATVTLLDGKDRSLLWSREFELPGGPTPDLTPASLTAARVLGCAAEGLDPGGKALSQETFKLYVTGCSQLPEAGIDDMPPVTKILSQVVRDAPAFKPGWAKLLLAEGADGAGQPQPAGSATIDRHGA